MDLSAKNEAYKSYLDQAKQSYSEGDIHRAKSLFLKAAEITNEIALQSKRVDIKHEYYQVTQKILSFVKSNCVMEVKVKKKDKEDSFLSNLEITSNKHISLEQALNNLEELIGLYNVKKTVKAWVNQIKVFQLRKEKGLKVPEMSYHMVFTGNPGTGKTSVARIMSQIYCALGILSKGHLVEVDRSKLVAGYVGQTAILTKNVIDSALDGVLFIDEAYTLSSGGTSDFGKEAIDTLIKSMEDKRNQFAVIVAGYSDLMNDFIQSNPGLKSRFKTYIQFEDYQPDDLFQIFSQLCVQSDYKLSAEARNTLVNYFEKLYTNRDNNFGNGRDVRNLFQNTITNQSQRVFRIVDPSIEELMEILVEDLQLN